MADGDQRLLRALEQLFETVGQTNAEELEALAILIEANSLAFVQPEQSNNAALDYINFNLNGVRNPVVGQLGYNAIDDTLDIVHKDGVTQQVGLETYALVENNTGSLIENGSVVGFAGVGTDEHLRITKYLADGDAVLLFALGIMTQDLDDSGEHGRCTVWGHVRDFDTTGSAASETWVIGDVLYASPTIAGGMTKVPPTAPNASVPIAAVLKVDATTGVIFVRPTIEQQKHYGQFSKTTDQSPAVINTAYPITFDATDISSGVNIGTTTSRIEFDYAGLYQISPSYQLSSTSASAKNVWIWARKNGVDIANSAMQVTLESNTAKIVAARMGLTSIMAGDYLELVFASDSTNVTLDAIPATAFGPSAPACTLAVAQIQQ
jgi:hypothetical protein